MGANVTIIKGQGGLNLKAKSDDSVCGLVIQAPLISPGFQGALGLNYYEPKQIFKIKDAEDLGITEAYDQANDVLAWSHISDYFRIHSSGELWIMIVSRNLLQWSEIVYTNTNNSPCQQLINASNGRIRMLGIVFNPTTAYTPLLYGGLDSKISTCVPNAQLLADYNFGKSKPVQVFLEGRQFNGTAAAALNLHVTYSAPNVSICIGADYSADFRNSLSNDYNSNVHVKYHAAVGALLGLYANAPVNVNAGYIGGTGLDLQDLNRKKFLATCLSSDTQYSDEDLEVLNEKGYQFFYKDIDAPGTYLKDTWTCVALTSDYYCQENGRTFNKAAKLVRTDIMPLQNAPVKLLPSGKLPREVIEAIKNRASKGLTEMRRVDEISNFSIEIDPDTDVLTTGSIDIYFNIQTTGTLRKLNGYVTLVPQIN